MPDQPTSYRAPHPRLAFRVGFTGHRPGPRLQRPDGELRAAIDAVLGAIIGAANDGRSFEWSYDRSKEPDIRMLNAVATGADTIAAAAAREAGLALECVLPFTREAYLEQDFATPADREACISLLDDTGTVSVFSLAMTRGAAIDWRGYRAAGEVIVDNCDVLLAVWDGEDSGKLGGTEDVVRMAIEREVPVVVIDATSDNPMRLLLDDTTGEEISMAAVRRHVLQMLTPPAARSHERPMSEVKARRRFFTEDRPGGASRLGRLIPWHRSAFLIARLVSPFAHGEAYPELPQLDPPPGGPLPAGRTSSVAPHFAAADAVSTRLGSVYRSSFTVLYLLSAVAVLTGLVAVFDFDNMVLKAWLVLAELGVIAVIIAMFATGRLQGWHYRWLDARRISELLRVADATVPLAGGAQRAAGAAAATEWTQWYVRAVLRESRLPQGVTTTPSYLHAEVRRFLDTLLDGQIRYHHQTVHAMRRLHRGLDHLGMLLLVLSAGVGAIYVAMVLFELVDTHADAHEGAFAHLFKPFVTFASAGFPALGAALYGVRAQGDYEATAERSADTLRDLVEVRRSLLLLLHNPAPEFPEVRAELAWAAEVMQSDLTLWRSLYRSRPLTMLA